MNVKVKFCNAKTKGLNWRFLTDPFPKIQSDLIFGRNKRDRAFIPLVGIRDLRDNDCVSLTKNGKGTNLITIPTPNVNPSAILLFATIEGGFRGGVFDPNELDFNYSIIILIDDDDEY